MNSYKNKIVGIILLVALAAVVVLALLSYFGNRYRPSGEGIDINEFVHESDLEIYRNDSLNFGLQHEGDWSVVPGAVGEVSIVPSSSVDGRSFVVTVVDEMTIEQYVSSIEEGGELVIFEEVETIPGYDTARLLKASTASGLDSTILVIEENERLYILDYHDFNEAHLRILSSFQILN